MLLAVSEHLSGASAWSQAHAKTNLVMLTVICQLADHHLGHRIEEGLRGA